MNITIINGPNLNLLGSREPGVYGNQSFDSYLEELRKLYPRVNLTYYQSNVEGELINEMQKAAKSADGIILNAGAYTHTSLAIGDAVKAIGIPVVEVHISNVYAREEFRKYSHIAASCAGTIVGFGLAGYRLAIESFLLKTTT